jgi:uncharacterized damage-inducible protein DinB
MSGAATGLTAAPGAGQREVAVLSRQLDDLATVLLRVPPAVYSARPLPVSGSVGEHVRHILDHVSALVVARTHAVLTYDSRERGTAVEIDSGVALRTILRLKAALADADDAQLDQPLAVASLLTRGGAPVSAWSTLRRELTFVCNHTVHHQALIAVLLSMMGVAVPEAFGLAPSTPRQARS